MNERIKLMKLNVIAVFTGLAVLAGATLAADKSILKDQKDRVSYSIGLNIGTSFKQQGIEVNPDIVAQGLKDALSGGQTLLTAEEARTALEALDRDVRSKMEAQNKVLADKNKKEGEAFLAANKKKQGVKTLPSGLQYKVVKEGTGKIPKATDTVTVQYRGTLVDGTEFDSSYKRGQPATFPVKDVIKGWTEALQLMKEGSKWQLFIPAELAYREEGRGQLIGPNSTLIFDIELLSIKPGS
jgi:FKBP-type peptidyl-prolyl cis-trans isomerase FklB